MHHNCHVKSASVCLQRLRACAAAGDFTRTKNGRSNCVAVVLPIALGAAVAASATILKAKCTLIVGANECAPACARNKGPLAPHVDLRDDAEKRAEEKAETAAHVQLERAMMREQQVALSATAEPRKSEQALAAAPPAKPQGDTHRRLVDDLAGTHRGLHSTGSVFVSSVDSSNASSFFLGGSTPFKALLITEVSVTPQWFKALASKHHGICAFGEARCTDTALMKMLGVFHEALPLCIVVTAYPEAVKAWQLMGCTLQLMKPDEKQASLYVFRTGNLTDEQLAGSIIRMIQVSNTERELHRRLLTSDGKHPYSSGTWF